MASNALNLVVKFSGVDNLSGSLKNLIGLGKTGSQEMRNLNRESGRLRGELRGVERSLAQGLASGAGNLSELAERQRQLRQEVAATNQQLERQKRLNAIDGTVARIHARGDELKSSGQQNIVGGVGLLTPFVLAGKAAMDFSSGMVDIQQKAELSNAETAQMARNLIAAADAAHQMPEAMRSGVDVLAGLGMDPRNAAQMIGPIGRLGTAFKVDLADGAQTAFANVNNLKVGLSDTAKALDIMAAGGNAGAFEVKDMARHFPGLTAQAQALGQSGLGAVADLTAALQIARRATGTADEAGTNVQNLLAKINSPTVINAFQKKFGVDLPAALKKAYAQGKTPMEALAEVTNKALGGDLGKLGFVVEDMQAQSALRALILNMDDYRKIRAQITNAGGTTDKAFRQRELQDASVAWNSFKGTVSALAITLGTTLLPVATEFFGYLNTGIGAISRWAQANPAAARSLMTLVAGFGAAKVGLGVLQYAFGSVIGPMATAWGWFAKMRALGGMAAMFPRLAAAFGILRTAAIFLGQGMMKAGLMMLANPMILIIVGIGVAIGALAYLVYRNWDTISAAFTAGVAKVKGLLGALPAWMRSVGSMMMQGLLSALSPAVLVQRLLSIARSGISAFKNFFGIKSPSRLFMTMGGHMTSGLAMGLDRGARDPLGAMSRMSERMAGGGPQLAPIAPRGGRAGGGGAAGGGGGITIQVFQQPGEDGTALARRVADELEQRARRSRLSSYQDDF